MTLSFETIVIGLLTGLSYAVLATGLVLVYRAARIINFAHGQIGAIGAAILVRLVLNYRWNFFVALVVAVAGGALVGAIVELAVVRRLFKAPRLIVLIATIGVAQFLLVLEYLLPDVPQQTQFPTPLDRSFTIGSLVLRSEHFMVLAFIPAAIAGLLYFLTRTPYGTAIRAVASNADAATLAGVSPTRVSTVVWSVAGGLAAMSTILMSPLRPSVIGLPTEALGPDLLLRALTAALVGGMVSIPWTLFGAVVIGIAEAVLFVNASSPSVVDALLFAAALVLIFTRARGHREEGTWSLTPKVPPPPARLLQVWWVRHMPRLAGGVGLLVALGLPWLFPGSGEIFLFSRVLIYAMIALSVSVLTGWAGQLSLGQFTLVGVGAMTTGSLMAHGMPFFPALAYATVAGMLVAVLVGFPALRVTGLHLAVATLAFAVAARNYFFTRPPFFVDDTVATVPRASVFGISLEGQRPYYYLVLAVLVAVVVVVARLRRTGVGRSIIAVRDNDHAASSFGVPPAATKLVAFGVSGGIAALAGALLAGLLVQFRPDQFGPTESLAVVAMTIIGGLGSVAGSVLGALYVVGLPALFGDSDQVGLMTSSVGLLILLLYFPGGLVQVAYQVRGAAFRWLERRLDDDAPGPSRPAAVAVVERMARPAHAVAEDGAVPLRCSNVRIAFGGLVAVDDVSIEVRAGEVVGLIGSNGAGKSTLMNAVSGFIPLTGGSINLWGTDVTGLPPHGRARLGVGRLFQDARMFPDLTVREAVQVALEVVEPSELVPSLLALPPSRRSEAGKAAEAAEYVGYLGLGRYADAYISDLSTGTRRIVELTCLLAQGSRLLLLDEPTAGVAQREAEAFGTLIGSIKDELGASVLIIEHDMPLVMAMSDRIYCLSAGKEIAAGLPDQIRNDPAVVAAYLGTDERAIQRSGAVATVTGARTR